MGFVLPYTHETLSLANCFPEASDNYPDLFEAVDQLLEQRFSYEDGTWNVDIPELGFEGTFEEESVNLGLKSAVGAWTTELDFSDIGFGELNFEWSGPADVFGAYGDTIGQTYAIKADFANLAATIEVETENDDDTMTDEFEVKVNLDQGSTANLEVSFNWNHEGDLFGISEQSYELEIETAIKGECPIGNCAIETDISTSHTIGGNQDDNTLALTYNMKPRIAWITALVNNDEHHVIGFRSENRHGKSTSFENLGYLSIYYKAFATKTGRPGKVANNGEGALVATIPLANGITEEVLPEIEDFLEPFSDVLDTMSENPQTIPNFLVHLDTWTLSLTKEFDASDIIAATRFESQLLHVENEEIQEAAESFNDNVIEVLQSDEFVEAFDAGRGYVLGLFGDEGKAVVGEYYL